MRFTALLVTCAAFLSLSITSNRAEAQTYSVVYAFPGGTMGAFPFGAVTRSHTGYVYGSTYNTDGANGGTGFGVQWEISPAGVETVIQNFQGPPNDGANPKGGTIHYHGMYSTTSKGGSSKACGGGCGVVWSHLINGGNDTPGTPFAHILHNFTAGTDGAIPVGDLARDSNYNLYGLTTWGGGTNPQCGGAQGCGVIYEVTQQGVETVMHRFSGADGQYPRAGLFLSSANILYGTTSAGGSANAGTVFQIDLSGNFTTLYQFQGGADGSDPEGSVALDATGNIYGTTLSGGGSTNCPGGCGTVYKIDTTGHETVLHAFGGSDGASPRGSIAIDDKGFLIYGITSNGGQGKPGNGVVYSVGTSGGTEQIIHIFQGGTDGAFPFGGVVKDAFGNLYGTTVYGGDMSCGTQGCGLLFTANRQ